VTDVVEDFVPDFRGKFDHVGERGNSDCQRSEVAKRGRKTADQSIKYIYSIDYRCSLVGLN